MQRLEFMLEGLRDEAQGEAVLISRRALELIEKLLPSTSECHRDDHFRRHSWHPGTMDKLKLG
ncbi:MAG: hypothetical protein AUF79_09245 [Crenarchaeota archaeon 13_1_20CM_2_51_8]|nr:MAG: hypothetical protein AUF79_09245 [Crenarchaeota archaeon 13_1_20CM_2_51_8]